VRSGGSRGQLRLYDLPEGVFGMKTKALSVGLLVLGLLAHGTVGPGPAVAAEEEQPALPEGMVLIPAGSFFMGDSFGEGGSDELPVHEVYVSAFYMDVHEVTKALWDEVAGWAVFHGYDIWPRFYGTREALDHPVAGVSWYEAVKWANARSEKEGLTPCYYTDAGHLTVYRKGQIDLQNGWVKWTADGYRLPTEAEWEKAAWGREAGRRYPWGDAVDSTRFNYWSPSQLSHGTRPVGSYAPNAYGLHDVIGNVREWCWDWYARDYYATLPADDPRGPEVGWLRVTRGGSWRNTALACRVAFRMPDLPAAAGIYQEDRGFRLVSTAP